MWPMISFLTFKSETYKIKYSILYNMYNLSTSGSLMCLVKVGSQNLN